MLLEVDAIVVAGNRLLRLRGELDIATAPQLAVAIDAELATAGEDFGLDLTDLSFVDSSGVRTMVNGFRRAQDQGVRMLVLLPVANRAVRRVFDLFGLVTAMPIVDVLVPVLPAQTSTPDQLAPPAGGPRVAE